jgi:hypothetical protein
LLDQTMPPELPSHLRKPRLRREEASEYLHLAHGIRLSPAYLAKLASLGGGPRLQYSVRTPLYPTDELDAWANRRLGGLVARARDAASAPPPPPPRVGAKPRAA